MRNLFEKIYLHPTPHPLYPSYIAQGSLKELETHLLLSIRVELAVAEVIDPVLEQCKLVGRILLGLIRSLESRT
ncbi:four helix bundle protein [Nodularia sp. LEGE 04288]|uniref:four helix bundle protein n=1 Tax=Nodularia sp. LEGE 04288 TaxID=1828639 RepID=UPI001D1083CD|nr:four helix bundle protein [Nodularia sp. LEGE 04288]MCC2691630.1 four helix bundle protein [Nodularia sp. LEGE 04288]